MVVTHCFVTSLEGHSKKGGTCGYWKSGQKSMAGELAGPRDKPIAINLQS